MSVKAFDIASLLEKWAPLSQMASWDRGGFQVGDPGKEVTRILVALDVDGEAVSAAIEAGAHMIISHHPLIFTPLDDLRLDRPQGALLARIIREDLVVYCAHTNLDQAPGGTDDHLARQLGLKGLQVLKPTGGEGLYKIVVFIPSGHEEQVWDAMTGAGAGHVGAYSHCTFLVEGRGTFQPLPGTNPFVGTHGRVEETNEYRLETVIRASLLSGVLEAMVQAHPYEEPAFDLFRLEREGEEYGFGRMGVLPEEITLEAMAVQVKKVLGLEQVRVVGEPGQRILKVATCAGSGGSLLEEALVRGADVFVTGDIKYHEAALAREAGMGVIDAGHHGTEKGIVAVVTRYLQGELAQAKGNVIVTGHSSRQPFRSV